MAEEQIDTPDGARIDLNPDEALVLFELLSRWRDTIESPTPDATHFESSAECAVLNGLLGSLEKQLSAPFHRDYNALVIAARNRLKDGWDYQTLRG